ncbi:hypothetical protein QBC35DRAFT_498262 [Podospora australis]|uniref:Uncharacterized protein n=1 Tax=Podospora australis TaxID=1536484 RepID=A0AAN6WUD9_9PEZI|nr:hypothetical protein QBC35DRAFT_498262 [Podospora australis]
MPGTITDSALIPINPGQIRRFYGAVVLLNVLNGILVQGQAETKSVGNLEAVFTKGPKEIYQCFVNKLAQILDIKRGGDNVTAISILHPGCIEYRISSNNRTESSYEEAMAFLKNDILGPLGLAKDSELEDGQKEKEMRSSMLLKILAFTQKRIRTYVRTMIKSLGPCIADCDRENGNEAVKMAAKLREMQPLASTIETVYSNKVVFTQEAHTLLSLIETNWSSSKTFERFLRAKSGPSHASRDQTSPWGDLFHAIGRLHSYTLAVQYFFEARRRWPILFEPSTLEITYVRSARRAPNPLQMKERACTGKDILHRLFVPKEPEVIAAYERLLPQLRNLNFDEKLKEEIKSSDYKTCVHAEIGLADSLYRDYRDPSVESSGVRFFDEAEFGRYIGCSKPTCLLCDIYLEVHTGMKFEWRKGHGNLYHKWRPSDIFNTFATVPSASDVGDATSIMISTTLGTELAETRRKIMEEMIKKVRRIVADTIQQRTGTRSKYDSRHTPSDPLGMGGVLSSRLGMASSTTWGTEYGSMIMAQSASDGNGGAWGRRQQKLEDVGEVTEDVASEEGLSSSSSGADETLTDLMSKLGVDDDHDDDDEGGGVRL